jgi:hypothetical protein
MGVALVLCQRQLPHSHVGLAARFARKSTSAGKSNAAAAGNQLAKLARSESFTDASRLPEYLGFLTRRLLNSGPFELRLR